MNTISFLIIFMVSIHFINAYMDINYNKKKEAAIDKEGMNEILYTTYSNSYDKIVKPGSFLRGWSMRPNSFDAIYTEYKKDAIKRKIYNDFMHDPIKNNNIKRFMLDMKSCVERKENLFYLFIGDTGSGKSWLVLYVTLLFCNLNNEFQFVKLIFSEKEVMYIDKRKKLAVEQNTVNEDLAQYIYWSYSTSESLDLVRKCKPKSLIIQDEAVIQHGKNSEVAADNFRNIISAAARREQINVFIINPDVVNLKGIQYYIKILGRNDEKKQILTYMFARKLNDLGPAIFDFDVSESITKAYDKKSKDVKGRIKESQGHSGVQISKEELNRCALILIAETEDVRDGCTKPSQFLEYQQMTSIANRTSIKLICLEAARLLKLQTAEVKKESESEENEEELDFENESEPELTELESATIGKIDTMPSMKFPQAETPKEPINSTTPETKLNVEKESEKKKEVDLKATMEQKPIPEVPIQTDIYKRFDIDSMKKYILSSKELLQLSVRDRKIFEYVIKDGLNFSDISKIEEIGLQSTAISKIAHKFREGHKETIIHLGSIFQDWVNFIVNGKVQSATYNRDCDCVDEKNKIIYSVKAKMENEKTYYHFATDFRPEHKYLSEHPDFEFHLMFINFLSPNAVIIDVKLDLIRFDSIEIDMANRFQQMKKDGTKVKSKQKKKQ